ncbi:MAG: chromate transporter [Candidatus Hydromicrobium sp.]|nr:chromate transporter [Candidatus Hydromicrobium sp.]
MIYLELLITFSKIGLFCFGGGYGMIPIIEREIVAHNWLTSQEFVNIISVSEMTPGPIAINTATFVGYKIGGIPGGALATIGVVLPSLILILGISHFLSKFQHHPIIKETIYGIRPVVLALIIQATIFVAKNTFFKKGINIKTLLNFGADSHFLEIINPVTIAITVVSLIILLVPKIHPILVILAAGAIGVILHYIGAL